MSVNPGFGGQEFIPNTCKKVKQLKKLIQGSECLIEVDGGVNYHTGKLLLEAGADVLVAGSFVFGSENPQKLSGISGICSFPLTVFSHNSDFFCSCRRVA
jgi:ribulose-phosphate 3-epimerase